MEGVELFADLDIESVEVETTAHAHLNHHHVQAGLESAAPVFRSANYGSVVAIPFQTWPRSANAFASLLPLPPSRVHLKTETTAAVAAAAAAASKVAATTVNAHALPQLVTGSNGSLKDFGEHAVAFITAVFISTFATKELALWQNNALFFVLVFFSWIAWQMLAQAVRVLVQTDHQTFSSMAGMDVLALVGHLLRYVLLWQLVRLVLDSMPTLLPAEALLTAALFLVLLVNVVWLMRVDALETEYTVSILKTYHELLAQKSRPR